MKKIILIAMAISCMLGICSCENTESTVAENFSGFRAVFLNTGKSDCIIVQMDDVVIMCDTADDDDTNYIVSAMKKLGVTKIDHMILTHFDKDHIGSAGAIIRNYDVGTVYAPEHSAKSTEYEKLTAALTLKNMEMTRLTQDVTFDTANGTFTIYAPLQAAYDDDNSYSLITAITYKDSHMLLSGDATKERLSEFLSEESAPSEYSVIKLPHHGEYTKSLLALISRAQPKYGIVTCDTEKSTVEKKLEKVAEQYNMELLYTFDGDITFTYENGEFVRK